MRARTPQPGVDARPKCRCAGRHLRRQGNRNERDERRTKAIVGRRVASRSSSVAASVPEAVAMRHRRRPRRGDCFEPTGVIRRRARDCRLPRRCLRRRRSWQSPTRVWLGARDPVSGPQGPAAQRDSPGRPTASQSPAIPATQAASGSQSVWPRARAVSDRHVRRSSAPSRSWPHSLQPPAARRPAGSPSRSLRLAEGAAAADYRKRSAGLTAASAGG